MSFFQTFQGGSVSINSSGGRRTQSISVRNGIIEIDGREYHGQNVVCDDEGIKIDGKLISPEGDSAPPKYRLTSVIIKGDAGDIETSSANVSVTGSVDGQVRTVSGSVCVEGVVDGNVETVTGSVQAAEIKGRVTTVSGSVSDSLRRKK
jgi:hypothetical protein